ncbi:hypothetical protein KM043_003894 [Ampulex compressa]|nr:hypothetical protein KM043_003894 [Ampulex compressa]
MYFLELLRSSLEVCTLHQDRPDVQGTVATAAMQHARASVVAYRVWLDGTGRKGWRREDSGGWISSRSIQKQEREMRVQIANDEKADKSLSNDRSMGRIRDRITPIPSDAFQPP